MQQWLSEIREQLTTDFGSGATAAAVSVVVEAGDRDP